MALRGPAHRRERQSPPVFSVIRVGVGIGVIDEALRGPALATDAWSHVAAVYDESLADNERVALYIDGALVNGTAEGSGDLPLQTYFSIGERSDGMQTFTGAIDEARLFSRALEPPDVAALAGEFR